MLINQIFTPHHWSLASGRLPSSPATWFHLPVEAVGGRRSGSHTSHLRHDARARCQGQDEGSGVRQRILDVSRLGLATWFPQIIQVVPPPLYPSQHRSAFILIIPADTGKPSRSFVGPTLCSLGCLSSHITRHLPQSRSAFNDP